MKATYGNLEVKGGVEQRDDGFYVVEIACPGCGKRYSLPNPPFTFDRERISIGPASVKLLNCGWHGYLTDGFWITSTDSMCGTLLAKGMAKEGSKVMAARETLKIGDCVSFLRMSNKSVALTGTVEKIYEEGIPLVEVKLDENGAVETAHLDDVRLLTEGEKDAAELRSEGIDATATPKGIKVEVDGPKEGWKRY